MLERLTIAEENALIQAGHALRLIGIAHRLKAEFEALGIVGIEVTLNRPMGELDSRKTVKSVPRPAGEAEQRA